MQLPPAGLFHHALAHLIGQVDGVVLRHGLQHGLRLGRPVEGGQAQLVEQAVLRLDQIERRVHQRHGHARGEAHALGHGRAVRERAVPRQRFDRMSQRVAVVQALAHALALGLVGGHHVGLEHHRARDGLLYYHLIARRQRARRVTSQRRSRPSR